jgi:hypothetical protein
VPKEKAEEDRNQTSIIMLKSKPKESSPHELEVQFMDRMEKACETRKITSQQIEAKLAELEQYKSLID